MLRRLWGIYLPADHKNPDNNVDSNPGQRKHYLLALSAGIGREQTSFGSHKLRVGEGYDQPVYTAELLLDAYNRSLYFNMRPEQVVGGNRREAKNHGYPCARFDRSHDPQTQAVSAKVIEPRFNLELFFVSINPADFCGERIVDAWLTSPLARVWSTVLGDE